MLKSNQKVVSLVILLILACGCKTTSGSSSNVKVEEVSQTDVGVVLDSISAEPYSIPIDETIFPTTPIGISVARVVEPNVSYYLFQISIFSIS